MTVTMTMIVIMTVSLAFSWIYMQERRILIEQVEQAHRLQNDAEKEADAALTQLEDFITEQEQLVGRPSSPLVNCL